jgi:cytidine deaminase
MADNPSGTIHVGANIENSSYGITACGEGYALNSTIAKDFGWITYLNR